MKLKYCLMLLTLACALGNAADVQKWTDQNGQVHYGERPPEGARTEQINTSGANVIDTSDQRRRAESMSQEIDSRRAYREKQQEKESQQAGRDQQRCERARQRIGMYRQKVPVFSTTPDGGRDYVEDDERADIIAKLEKDIRRYCR